MINSLLVLLIGMFIGWNLPQPFWAKAVQAWVQSKIQDMLNR